MPPLKGSPEKPAARTIWGKLSSSGSTSRARRTATIRLLIWSTLLPVFWPASSASSCSRALVCSLRSLICRDYMINESVSHDCPDIPTTQTEHRNATVMIAWTSQPTCTLSWITSSLTSSRLHSPPVVVLCACVSLSYPCFVGVELTTDRVSSAPKLHRDNKHQQACGRKGK